LLSFFPLACVFLCHGNGFPRGRSVLPLLHDATLVAQPTVVNRRRWVLWPRIPARILPRRRAAEDLGWLTLAELAEAVEEILVELKAGDRYKSGRTNGRPQT
jgi:hypothetical protein